MVQAASISLSSLLTTDGGDHESLLQANRNPLRCGGRKVVAFKIPALRLTYVLPCLSLPEQRGWSATQCPWLIEERIGWIVSYGP